MQPFENPEDDVSNEYDLMGVDAEIDDNSLDGSPTKKKRRKTQKDIVQRFVFFDLETTQEKVIKETELGPELEHVPNVAVAMITCDDCRKRDFDFPCSRCGEHKKIFTGETCLNDFCRFLFNKNMKIRRQLPIIPEHSIRNFCCSISTKKELYQK